jgi:hypothetical protein
MMRFLIVLLASACCCANIACADESVVTPLQSSPMPQREHDLIAILADARTLFDHARLPGQKRDTRIAMQTKVATFMEQDAGARDWVGTVEANDKLADGAGTLSVEIAPGMRITTWPSRVLDDSRGTLITAHSPLAANVRALRVGQQVVFNAEIVMGRAAADDDMIDRPELIATFGAVRAVP